MQQQNGPAFTLIFIGDAVAVKGGKSLILFSNDCLRLFSTFRRIILPAGSA